MVFVLWTPCVPLLQCDADMASFTGLLVHYGITQEARRVHYFLTTAARDSLADTNFDI